MIDTTKKSTSSNPKLKRIYGVHPIRDGGLRTNKTSWFDNSY